MYRLLLVVFFLSGCNAINSNKAIKNVCALNEVETSDAINVLGEVSGVVSIAGKGGYKLTDGSCTVSVIFSSKGSPKIGDKIIVTGKIKELLSVGSRKQILLIEESRKQV